MDPACNILLPVNKHATSILPIELVGGGASSVDCPSAHLPLVTGRLVALVNDINIS